MQASLHTPRGMEWRHQQHQQPSPSPMPMPLPLASAQSPFQVNAGAQEVCVIQRTVRQETMAAANLINFGGLEGGIIFKQQQGQQSNQLLALVQQQQKNHSVPQELYSSAAPLPLPRSSSLPSPYFGDATLKTHPPPRTSSFGRVSTVDIHGLPFYGELLLTDKAPRFDARLEIICSCHGFHFSVSKFVQHVNASHSINPGSIVVMDNGQSLLQWRKSLFARLGVKIDDDAGWDWNDASGGDAARTSRPFDLAGDSAYVNSQLTHPPVAPPALSYNNSNNNNYYHFQALHRCSASQSHSAVSKPTGFLNQSSSEYFDFINPGGNRAYGSAPSEQQQQIGVGEKFGRADHGLGELRPDVSSIELRLGQPSQQGHKTGKSFDALRSQYQFQALEPSFHHHDYDLNVHQANQQQRVEKVNVLNFNQFGSSGLERTVYCEQTKMWTNSAHHPAIQNEASRVTLETFTPSQPDYPLDHVIKKVASARQLHNVTSGSNHIDLSGNSAQQQTTWTLSSSRVESGIMQCGEKYTSGADVLPFYGRRVGSGSGEGYRQQQHAVDLTASLLDDRDSVRIVEVRNTSAGCGDLPEDNSMAKGKHRLLSETSFALEKRHQAALVEANRPADFSNIVREDQGGMPLDSGRNEYSVGQVLDHNDETALPASSGALVSVGENEFPVTRCHLGTTPVSQPFEWKAPLKSVPPQVLEQEEDRETDEKSGSADGNEGSSKEGLLSEVSTKSSENVLSGFSDARHLNEETSTLESGSQRRDVVDEGSGIEKCCSEEQGFAGKTVSAEPRDSMEKRESSVDASSGTMAKVEASGRGEEAMPEDDTAVDERRLKRKRCTKWKSVNGDCMTSALSDSENSKQTPRRQRNARASKRRPQKPQRLDSPAQEETGSDRHAAARRGGPSKSASGKMMSIKEIMENSGGQKLCAAASLPKQTRKRKLCELSMQGCSTLRTGPLPLVIPRGERSPRGRKGGVINKEQGAPEMVKVPKRRRDFQVPEDAEGAAAKRKKQQPPPSAPQSCIDELTTGSEKVKWKSLRNDSLDGTSPTTKANMDCAHDLCSVCGSSSAETHNQLVNCSSCSIKVHQACYGVPKVPKASWCCRPCKSNSADIVCVLCGYGGGALTRAQKGGAAVEDLLKLWNARGLRRSSRRGRGEGGGEQEEISNSVTASVADPGAAQWTHMVCALWMPGTRCLNMETMSAFDVSAVSPARRRMTCSICKRQGGSCIQCNDPKCAVPFHPWCAHNKGLLHIQTVNDAGGHVRFHGNCIAHQPGRSSKLARTPQGNKKPR